MSIKWKARGWPTEGEKRTRKVFLFWPRQHNGYWYWGLCTVVERWTWDEGCEELAEPEWERISIS